MAHLVQKSTWTTPGGFFLRGSARATGFLVLFLHASQSCKSMIADLNALLMGVAMLRDLSHQLLLPFRHRFNQRGSLFEGNAGVRSLSAKCKSEEDH